MFVLPSQTAYSSSYWFSKFLSVPLFTDRQEFMMSFRTVAVPYTEGKVSALQTRNTMNPTSVPGEHRQCVFENESAVVLNKTMAYSTSIFPGSRLQNYTSVQAGFSSPAFIFQFLLLS